MVDLVKITRRKIITDSYIIAEKFGKKHEYVMRKIETLKQRLAARKFASKIPAEIISRSKEYRGQDFRYYELNKKAFSLLIMDFTGDKAFEWKEKFYDAFALMEQALLNSKNTQYKEERLNGTEVRVELTDIIKEFIEYASTQGSKSASMYYQNITKMEYRALGLIEKNEKVSTNFRNTLNLMQLHQLTIAEYVAKDSIVEGIFQRLHYKDIYQLAKQNVLNLAETMLIKKIN